LKFLAFSQAKLYCLTWQRFVGCSDSMTHPLVPQVIDLAAPVAEGLGLEVVDAVFQTNQSPPVLRLDVRSLQQEDTSLDDCEKMSQALEAVLDTSDIIPDAYVLEISSPGISDQLTTDRDFAVFKGFMVEVHLLEPYKGKQTWVGQLVRRDEKSVVLTQKGKPTNLPREWVEWVQLSNESPG
jgi:ribosome maturation factor RimP